MIIRRAFAGRTIRSRCIGSLAIETNKLTRSAANITNDETLLMTFRFPVTTISFVVLAGVIALGQAPLFPLSSPVPGPNGAPGLPETYSVGDFNSDGFPDIIAGVAPTIGWVLGGPGGIYGPPSYLPLAPQTLGTFLSAGADIDGDSNEDVVLSYGSFALGAHVCLMLGSGFGQFSLSPDLPLPTGYGYYAGYAVDIIPGGSSEVILQSAIATPPYSRTYSIWTYYTNAGGWTQLTTSGINTSPAGIEMFADVNGDGYLDGVGVYVAGNFVAGIAVLPGLASPLYFGQPVYLPRPANMGAWSQLTLSVGDVNNDGCQDIVARDGTGTADFIITALGNPQTVLSGWITSCPASPYIPNFGTRGSSLHLKDFDGDGLIDLIATVMRASAPGFPPFDLHFHRGDGTGHFSSTPLVLTNNPPGFEIVHAMDADRDGDADLVSWTTATTSVLHGQSILGSGIQGSMPATPRMLSGYASPGNPSFFVGVDGAAPLMPCLLAASLAKVTPTPASAIALDLSPASLLWPLGTVGPSATNSQGRALFSVPLPNTPSLTGARVYLQWAVADLLTPTGYVLTPGRQIIFW